MTRIFTDGAEFGDMLFWDSWTCTIDSNTKRSGLYSYYTNSSGATKNLYNLYDEAYFRICVNRYNYGGEGTIFGVLFDGTGLISLYEGPFPNAYMQIRSGWGGTVLATGTHSQINNTWHMYEIYIKIADSGGRVILYTDGLLDIDYTGDTLLTAYSTFNQIRIDGHGSAWVYFDDLAMNDTSGSEDNSWCGDGKIILLTPSGSGTTNNWLNSGSVSGSANYLYVDDFPSDSDTTYVYASASSTGAQDQYALSNFTGGNHTNITRIFAEARIKMATTGSDVVKLGYLPDGGTDQLSGSIALTTNYTRIVGTSASANPVTGLPWTASDIDGLEYVIEVG